MMARGTFDHDWHRLELRFEQLSQHLDRLDAVAVAHVTKYFAAQAALLRRKRRRLDQEARQWREAHAIVQAQPAYPDTPNGRRRRREAELKARAIEIMRLAGRGWSNTKIGLKMGMSAGNVSRIIQRQLNLTRKAP